MPFSKTESWSKRIMRWAIHMLRETVDICIARGHVQRAQTLQMHSVLSARSPTTQIKRSVMKHLDKTKRETFPGMKGFTFTIDNKEFVCQEQLGSNWKKGTSTWIDSNQKYVIKIAELSPKNRNLEFEMLKFLEQKGISGIVRAFGATSDEYTDSFARKKFDIMVLDYAGETLAHWLGKGLNTNNYIFGMLSLSCSLAGCHASNIIHCDIKPDNIAVMEKDGVLKFTLLDFDLAHHFVEHGDKTLVLPTVSTDAENAVQIPSGIGSGNYRAPELFESQVDFVRSRTCKIDVFSLGCTFHDMINENAINMSYCYRQNDISRILEFTEESGYMKRIVTLIQSMQEHDPERRPSSREVATQIEKVIRDFNLVKPSRTSTKQGEPRKKKKRDRASASSDVAKRMKTTPLASSSTTPGIRLCT